ncbi:hypothetical protein W02_06810 [Nitrospira sp. KM1]|uniref:aldo/keto reductase n=1 Tax=Nitrospira sp. KM1 TaxID=1936990 RepID=UPI0013A745F6|nr:aldo/keto reductase [Nitrospira sp. KM1]BCA53541.1 hypothetical protein W02_06810 [Nitrospira sp. KM1]
MSSPPNSSRANRLSTETSPYLLQHAHNPVDWYPWGPEALATAKRLNRPILLSIGYSACHWCHVMERESFENETIAALMNRHFVCIKVDREERPDLDDIYMQATVTLNHGQGGWPMTVFLTPEQQPFFAGTYFPPEDRWGRPGFPAILKKIAAIWEENPGDLRQQARQLTDRLKAESQTALPASVDDAVFDDAVREFSQLFDERFGGFGQAPKFPPAAGLSLLLRCHRRTGDPHTLRLVTKTLDAMAAGGIYDHVGGGFARYSTDERWLVPHFEKMLYDNALLTRTYLEAFQVTGRATYRQVVMEVLDYILKEMTDSEGGFYSATDADSEGVEGKFFVWTPEDVRKVLADEQDSRRICACYDITEKGNWEHRSIPNRLRPIESVAKELDVTVDELTETMRRVRPALYQARSARVPPGLDDKIIAAWNGMMIAAMAEAGRVLGVARFIDAARRAADFLLRVHLSETGQLLRTSRNGHAHLNGVLEDYAYLGEGLVDLYEACGDDRYLDAALGFGVRILDSFEDKDHGGFFTTADDHEQLIVRGRDGADGATPSSNAVAASLLARLSYHDDRQDFRNAAVRAIRSYGKQISRYPRAFAKSLAVVDFLTEGPLELAVVGEEAGSASNTLRGAIGKRYLPNRIIALTTRADGQSAHPLLSGKGSAAGKPALYICRNFTCQRPVTDPLEALQAVAAADQGQSAFRQSLLADSPLPGAATPEGTARFAASMVHRPHRSGSREHGYGPFGSTGLTASKLGFGGYRVDSSNPEFSAALTKALSEGVNVIDTSTNYMDGESERLIGSVLKEVINRKIVSRDQIIVVSKIGYVQGENLRRAQAREQANHPYPDMVKYGDGIWHCIHPDFLADQLTASLDRLGVATLDVCLLHNPEYFLSEITRHGNPQQREQARDEFYRRVALAFDYLDSQVSNGRIRWYGVSSNTVAADQSDPDATSLHRYLTADRQRHFAVLQCPMNLFESSTFLPTDSTQQETDSVLTVAQKYKLAVLVNRPLNAMATRESGMLRLAEVPPEGTPIDLLNQLTIVKKLEDEYRATLAPVIPHGGEGTAPAEFFRWADELGGLREKIQGLEHWEQIEHQMIAPHVNQVLQSMPRLIPQSSAEQWETWRDRYVQELLALLGGLRHDASVKSASRAQAVTAALHSVLPAEQGKKTLSRKALWTLVSTPGIACVLVGMRTRVYVDDALEVMNWKPLADVKSVYLAARRAAQSL